MLELNMDVGKPQSEPPGLTQFDRECIERLLKAGHVATAVKFYRLAYLCSVKEAEQAIKGFSATTPWRPS
jgi:hypothetical protein